MRPVLAIVGCGARLEVGVVMAPGRCSQVALAGPRPRSELVVAAVDLLFRTTEISARDLGAVLATRGPGSFTGIRVGLATAQGIGLAAGVPAFGLPSLLVQAARTREPRCLAVQPARRGLFYAQPFVRAGDLPRPEAEPSLTPATDLVNCRLPVVAPYGSELPGATPLAVISLGVVEALVAVFHALPEGSHTPLSPIYQEPPAAVPPTPRTPPWQRSQTAS